MKKILLFLLIAISIQACNKDEETGGGGGTPPPLNPDYKLLKELTTEQAYFNIQLLGFTDFVNGYNTIRYIIKDANGEVVNNATISVYLTSSTGETFPVRQPKVSKNPDGSFNGFYVGGLIFDNSNNANNTYSINIQLAANGIGDFIVAPIVAGDLPYTRIQRLEVIPGEGDYIIAQIRPIPGIKVGASDYLAYYITQQDLTNSQWSPILDLSGFATLIFGSERADIDLLRGGEGIYISNDQIEFLSAGDYQVDVTTFRDADIVFEDLEFVFQIEE